MNLKSRHFTWASACLILLSMAVGSPDVWSPGAQVQAAPVPVEDQSGNSGKTNKVTGKTAEPAKTPEAKPGKAARKKQPTLDDLLNLTPKGKANDSGTNAKPGSSAGSEADISPKQAGHLFQSAVAEMERAANQLDRDKEAGLATQRVQQSVLAKLDQVISSAQRRRSRGGKGADGAASESPPKPRASAGVSKPGQGDRKSKAGQQAATGGASPGNSGRGVSGNSLRENRTEWGHLPIHLRKQLLQGLGETFSPLYQTMTEEYYRLLAEQENQP
jgi:hypothetical protein